MRKSTLRSRRNYRKSQSRSADGRRGYKKLPHIRREKFGSFGREDAIAGIPGAVVAVPIVDVPLAAVPVHVHDAGPLVSGAFYSTTLRILSGLNLIRGIEAR